MQKSFSYLPVLIHSLKMTRRYSRRPDRKIPVSYTHLGNLMITIEETGVTEPDELVDVGAQVSGIIMEFGKDLNGKVVDCLLYTSRCV